MATTTERLPRPEAPTSAQARPSVLAVVVTHQGREWFKHCLVGLNTQTYDLLDVLVVDDASLDSRERPTLKRVSKRHLRRRRWGYLRTPRPLGFGGAINWALSRVRTDADLLLFIHDDAVLEPEAVERMIARLSADEDTAIVGPKIVSWDDPERLEEVGMAIDRFGYPYKGLEDDEIDLGQHDTSVEVFYVTSTCMLVRHDVFRKLRGWDARLRAFSEDLDLCWRARVAGHQIRVEPAARARHAIAMATGQRSSPFSPHRYYIRRNRMRVIAKNVSTTRLLALWPLYVLLSFGEMLGFIVLRQPGEVLNLARAVLWNFLRLPQTLSERARVQRLRQISDRTFKKLTVREMTRVRAYISNQAERLEETWGRRAEVLARRTEEARALRERMKGLTGVLVVMGLVLVFLGFRHLLWGSPASIGELLPYPDRATALWRSFASPWHGAGLGQTNSHPPAFALLGIFPLLTLGAAGAAQKLLLLTLGAAAFAGAHLLVAELVDRRARIVAGLAYSLGAVGYASVRGGSLGAMVFGAAAPFVLVSMIRLTGWVRPPGWNPGRAVASLAIAAAVSAAFVPGSLVFYVVAAVLLAAMRGFLDRGTKPFRAMISSLLALIVSWIMLLPWSSTWFDPGGPIAGLVDDDLWRIHASGFSGHDVLSVVLGQTPDAPVLFGLALPLLGLIAVMVAEGQRRKMAIALWGLVVADAWLVSAISSGTLRPFVASPTEAGVLASLAFAGLAGLAAGAFRLDLPRRGLGFVHALTLGGVAVSAFLIVAGAGQALVRGAWEPGRASERIDASVRSEVADFMEVEALEGQFRALWVGQGWQAPASSAARPIQRYIVSGPRGQVLTDLFDRGDDQADGELDAVVRSIVGGATDRGGTLLGAFNIRYVVLERGPGAYHWLNQRDLALVRPSTEYLLLENTERLERAAVYEEMPTALRVVETGDSTLSGEPFGVPRVALELRSAGRYATPEDRVIKDPRGALVLAEAKDAGWEASVDGEELETIDGGWANAFDLGGAPDGTIKVAHPRSLGETAWLIFIGLLWILVIGAAFPRRRGTVVRKRRP